MVYFRMAGDYSKVSRLRTKVLFASRHRQQSLNSTISHRNDFNSEWRLPNDFYKLYFKYDRKLDRYTTNLTYGDILQFLTVESV